MTEPYKWKVLHYATVGMEEEFVEFFTSELPRLVDATMIFDPERQQVKEAMSSILIDGLIPAFEHLKKIRASVTQQLPVVNHLQLFEDFSRVLWHVYKDLMPKATLLLGFDLGFLFQNDNNFEKGVIEFNKRHPSLIGDVGDFLRHQRATWQNGLKEFRNDYLEHKKEERNKFAKYYNSAEAEVLFDSAWRTMAFLFPVFVESHMNPPFSIESIPANERETAVGRRQQYRFVWLQASPKP